MKLNANNLARRDALALGGTAAIAENGASLANTASTAAPSGVGIAAYVSDLVSPIVDEKVGLSNACTLVSSENIYYPKDIPLVLKKFGDPSILSLIET